MLFSLRWRKKTKRLQSVFFSLCHLLLLLFIAIYAGFMRVTNAFIQSFFLLLPSLAFYLTFTRISTPISLTYPFFPFVRYVSSNIVFFPFLSLCLHCGNAFCMLTIPHRPPRFWLVTFCCCFSSVSVYPVFPLSLRPCISPCVLSSFPLSLSLCPPAPMYPLSSSSPSPLPSIFCSG